MRYKPYKGKDKYHFRGYKRGGGHPTIIVEVRVEGPGRILLSGYSITHSPLRSASRKRKNVQLLVNPSPNDPSKAYVKRTRINSVSFRLFTDPICHLHLSKEDEHLIETWESVRKKK